IGNNTVNVAASSLATGVLLYWFGDVGVVYAAIGMTVVIVVFAEVLPKTAALRAPDHIALAVARPVDWTVRALGPVLLAIEGLVRLVFRILGMAGKPESILSPHGEFRGAVDLLHPAGRVVE